MCQSQISLKESLRSCPDLCWPASQDLSYCAEVCSSQTREPLWIPLLGPPSTVGNGAASRTPEEVYLINTVLLSPPL